MTGIGWGVTKEGPTYHNIILYSQKIWRGIKFGGLAVYITTAKLKSAKISYSHIYVWRSRTEPPKFKSANILLIAIWGSTAKFNVRQYFRLYGIYIFFAQFIPVYVGLAQARLNKWFR